MSGGVTIKVWSSSFCTARRLTFAQLNGTVIAESDKTESMSGYLYVPHEAIVPQYFTKTSFETTCPMKGTASYYNISVNDTKLSNACWYYPNTKDSVTANDDVTFSFSFTFSGQAAKIKN